MRPNDEETPTTAAHRSYGDPTTDTHGGYGDPTVKDFILTQVGYTRYCFIHNSELGHHLSEWPS